MSRDASGNYSLPSVINPVLPNTVIATTWANPTLSDIATALSDSLSRSGKGGMGAPLVMNGYKITNIGFATAATDAPQAIQVRDQAFTGPTSLVIDSTGNNYVATALLAVPSNNGTMYRLIADRDNTGPMTLSVNSSAALPMLINGAPTPPGFVRAGAVFDVLYVNLTYRIVGISTSGSGTVNSVQSSDPAVISVVNDIPTAIATLTPHTNVAGGMTKLDSSGKVPIIQLPFTDIHFVGVWNASPGVLPSTSGLFNGNFYVITLAGTLSLFRVTAPAGNIYTAQSTPVAVGDAIILRLGSTNPNAPDGWYFDPQSSTIVAASTVVMNPTPTLPAVNDAQAWMNQMDPIIASKLPLAGGTMTGPIVQPALPATASELANRQYVDNKTAALVGVLSFNSRTGAVGLTSSDVTGALGYAPANAAGQTFTGNISAPAVASTGFVTSGKGFYSSIFSFIATGNVTVDFNNGQSQIYYLSGATIVTSVDNIPQGAILRLVVANTNIPVTWPGTVHWPLGVTPALGAGPLHKAIVVFESDGTDLLATATVY